MRSLNSSDLSGFGTSTTGPLKQELGDTHMPKLEQDQPTHVTEANSSVSDDSGLILTPPTTPGSLEQNESTSETNEDVKDRDNDDGISSEDSGEAAEDASRYAGDDGEEGDEDDGDEDEDDEVEDDEAKNDDEDGLRRNGAWAWALVRMGWGGRGGKCYCHRIGVLLPSGRMIRLRLPPGLACVDIYIRHPERSGGYMIDRLF